MTTPRHPHRMQAHRQQGGVAGAVAVGPQLGGATGPRRAARRRDGVAFAAPRQLPPVEPVEVRPPSRRRPRRCTARRRRRGGPPSGRRYGPSEADTSTIRSPRRWCQRSRATTSARRSASDDVGSERPAPPHRRRPRTGRCSTPPATTSFNASRSRRATAAIVAEGRRASAATIPRRPARRTRNRLTQSRRVIVWSTSNAATAGMLTRPSASSIAQKPGQLLDTTSGSSTSMPSCADAEHGEGHRQAVVVVRPEARRVDPVGLDAQSVVLLPGVARRRGAVRRTDRRCGRSPCRG